MCGRLLQVKRCRGSVILVSSSAQLTAVSALISFVTVSVIAMTVRMKLAAVCMSVWTMLHTGCASTLS